MYVLLVSILFPAFFCASVVYEDCGSAYVIEDVSIDGCGYRLPCYVTLGEDIPVNITFLADNTPTRLDQDVVINLNFVNLPTYVSPDPCDRRQCPVTSGQVTNFRSVMSIPTNMALNQRGWLNWRVYDQSNRLVVCYSVMVQTQSSLQKIMNRTGFNNFNLNKYLEVKTKLIPKIPIQNNNIIYK